MVIMFPQQEHNPMPGRHFRSFTAVSADKDQINTATSGPGAGWRNDFFSNRTQRSMVGEEEGERAFRARSAPEPSAVNSTELRG
jgi:capsular polysaccharide biosynthesis protein